MNQDNKIINIINDKCDLNNIIKEYDSIAIIGPTASGKSQVAMEVSQLLNIPIINIDSQQFLKNYPILTCSPSYKEKQYTEHILYNFLDDSEKFPLGNWIEKISTINNKLLVGGSMFFIYCLQNGFPMIKISESTREMVKQIENKYEFLNQVYPKHNLHKNNLYRINRLLEFYLETGYDFVNYPKKYREKIFVIWLDKKNLLDMIIKRTNTIFASAVEEVKQYDYNSNVKSIIGYEEIWNYINNKSSYEQAMNDTIVKIYQYGKYQRKWKKKLKINLYINL